MPAFFQRYFVALALFLGCSFEAHPQNLPTSALAVEKSVDAPAQPNSFAVPIRMQGSGFYAVNGFSYFIQFDASRLQFAGVEQLALSPVSYNSSGNLISLNWSGISNPVNLTNNTIVCNLLFNRIAHGDVLLSFLPGSKVSGTQGLIAVNYVGGTVISAWELTTLSIPAQGGTTAGGGMYAAGQNVNVSATPGDGYLFEKWTQNGAFLSASPSFGFTMPAANTTLEAHFTPKTYQVITHAQPSQGGTTTGDGFYDFGQIVTVTASASTGFQFSHWILDGQEVSNSAAYSFPMPAGDIDLWARFEPLIYQLQLNANPADAGTTSGAGYYSYQQQVTAKAFPETGYHFFNWTQAGSVVSTNAIYTFQMPASNLLLTARFLINNYTISVEPNNADYGTVSGSGTFEHGSTVSVSAQPNEDYIFVAWIENGISVSFNAIYSFVAESDRTLTAIFQEQNACPKPTNLAVSNLSETTATLHWISPMQNNQWFVLWGIAANDTLQGEGWLELSATNLWTLEDLSPQTLYVFYVKTLCDEVGESTWSDASFFQTWFVGYPKIAAHQPWKLYPNPGNGKVFLKADNLLPGQMFVKVCNLKGEILKQIDLEGIKNHALDLTFLPKGVYILQFSTPETSFSLRYLKIY